MNDSTYTVAEIAERFRVSRETVRRWISSGQLRGIDVSGKRRSKKPRYVVEGADLAAFKLRRACGAPAPPRSRRKAPAGVVEIW